MKATWHHESGTELSASDVTDVDTPDLSRPLSEWSSKELIAEWVGIEQLVSEIKCYGTTDLRQRQAIELELEDRGWKLTALVTSEIKR